MYDVTFHPITEEEIKNLIFSVISNENQPRKIIESLNISSDEAGFLEKVYVDMIKKWKEIREKNTTEYFTWSCAAIAGYLRPFWWGKNSALKNLPNFEETFQPKIKNISTVDENLFGDVSANIKNLTLNDSYGGGGYIPPENIAYFRKKLSEIIGIEEEWDQLIFALEYAQQNKCGIIEASGIYDTLQGSVTDQKNLRTIIVRASFPFLSISMPDELEWENKAKNFLKQPPAEYYRFVREHLFT